MSWRRHLRWMSTSEEMNEVRWSKHMNEDTLEASE